MKRSELLIIANELILDESVQRPMTIERFHWRLFDALAQFEYQSRQKRLSAIQSPLDNESRLTNSIQGQTGSNQGQTYAAASSADLFVNRPRLDPALPDADRSAVY